MPKDKVGPSDNDVALAKIRLDETRLKESTIQHRYTVIGQVIMQGEYWGGISIIFISFVICIYFLAGHSTTANITVDLLGKYALPWSGTAGATIYGLSQKKAKHDQLERDSRRIAELEKRIDAKRTSSNLTERGETRPEDNL
jgi:hypothetical protein